MCKEEGTKIDPETAELHMEWGNELEPYGLLDLPACAVYCGKNYFARRPGGKVWVYFGDLPEKTVDALLKRMGQKVEDAHDDDLPL